jgi:toxin ParE1/3/4
LREIVSYIARDSPDRARAFGNTLIDKALSIGAFPEMGQIVLELGDPSVREIIHGSYRIICIRLTKCHIRAALLAWS